MWTGSEWSLFCDFRFWFDARGIVGLSWGDVGLLEGVCEQRLESVCGGWGILCVEW